MYKLYTCRKFVCEVQHLLEVSIYLKYLKISSKISSWEFLAAEVRSDRDFAACLLFRAALPVTV